MNRVAFTIQSGQKIVKAKGDQQFENGMRRTDANSGEVADRYEVDDNKPVQKYWNHGEDAFTEAPPEERGMMLKSLVCYAIK